MVCIDKAFVIFKGLHIQGYPSALGEWGGGKGRGWGPSPGLRAAGERLPGRGSPCSSGDVRRPNVVCK